MSCQFVEYTTLRSKIRTKNCINQRKNGMPPHYFTASKIYTAHINFYFFLLDRTYNTVTGL